MTKRTLNGVELRYVLTFYLSQHGRTTVGDLVEALDYYNFAAQGRASKCVSDALRWEATLGRVRKLRRGLYGPGEIPRSTEDRIRKRVLALRDEAAAMYAKDDEAFWNRLLA